MHRFLRTFPALFCGLAFLAAAQSPTPHTTASLAVAPTTASRTEARGVWVTRGQYKSAEDVETIMRTTAELGFNLVLFQVRGNGTVFYKSEIEPWAYELTSDSPESTGKDPGWDPLAVAVQAAHRHGIKIHAWVNVFPAWRGQSYPPASAGQLWTAHPDWIMVHKDGKKMIPRDRKVDPTNDTWYSFLNPAHPEVQKYIPRIFVELARNYDIDGIHYDYVRYPGEIDDFSYDEISLKRFREESGKTPDEAPQEWIEWRGKQVTGIVRQIYKEVTAIKPQLVVGGAVIANFERAKQRYFARSQEWLKEGILDVAIPMNYYHGEGFTTQTQDFVAHSYRRHVYIGISGGGARDDDGSSPTLLREIEEVRSLGAQGVVIFSYGSLVGRRGELSRQGRLVKDGPFREPAQLPPMPWKQPARRNPD